MRNANRAAQTFAVRTARYGQLTVLAGAYRKPVFAGGAGGDGGGAFATGADSLPFSREGSALSRPLSGG